jgi:hypothetical protein
MKIDKSVGTWLDSATHLDDIAYYFYLQDNCINKDIHKLYDFNGDPTPQDWFIQKQKRQYLWTYKYYDKAESYIRSEKLLKLKEIINENR